MLTHHEHRSLVSDNCQHFKPDNTLLLSLGDNRPRPSGNTGVVVLPTTQAHRGTEKLYYHVVMPTETVGGQALDVADVAHDPARSLHRVVPIHVGLVLEGRGRAEIAFGAYELDLALFCFHALGVWFNA
jgi:hypothetical protein